MKDLDLQLLNTLTFPNRSYSTCDSSTSYKSLIRRLMISPDRRFLYGYRYGLYDDAFRPDNADDCGVCVSCLIEVQTGDVLSEEERYCNDQDYHPCALSPDSQFLAFYENTICIARLQDFHKGRRDRQTASNYTRLRYFTFHPDSTRLTPKYLGRLRSVTFSPDGLRVAAGGDDKTIYIWNLTTGEQKTILTGHSNPIQSVAFSPDGLTLASGSWDNTIHLWDVASYERKTILTGHSNGITSVAFSPDGLTLASGSPDNTIHLWDLANYEQKIILTGISEYTCNSQWINSIAFSPDSLTLASGSEYGIRFWNLECYQLLHTIKSPGVVSQDGKTFVIQADGNEKIEVWSWKFIPI